MFLSFDLYSSSTDPFFQRSKQQEPTAIAIAKELAGASPTHEFVEYISSIADIPQSQPLTNPYASTPEKQRHKQSKDNEDNITEVTNVIEGRKTRGTKTKTIKERKEKVTEGKQPSNKSKRKRGDATNDTRDKKKKKRHVEADKKDDDTQRKTLMRIKKRKLINKCRRKNVKPIPDHKKDMVEAL